MDNIKPLYDRILVKIGVPDEKTEGGIILPDSSQEKPQQGEVVAVGNGKLLDNGTLKPLDVKKGDVVLDPFMGSGTTALAAISLNRHFIGAETNEKYYKYALETIKEIGKKSKKRKNKEILVT